MKGHYDKVATVGILLIPLLFVLRGGYLQEVTGYVYLFLLQGYVAWFLFFKSGQPFFGYSVTMAIGAYGTIVLNLIKKWPLPLAILISAMASSIVCIVIFIATIRARGFYVSMSSFLLAILFPNLINALRDITGGRSGLYFTGLAGIIGIKMLYIFVIIMTVLVAILFLKLMSTKTGTILTLVSENDTLTQAVGINTFTYKLLAYAEEIIPGLREHTKTRIIMTPDDFKKRINVKHHSFGGSAPKIGYPPVTYKTPIEGLWFAGCQSESTGGVANTMNGAKKLAKLLLKKFPGKK